MNSWQMHDQNSMNVELLLPLLAAALYQLLQVLYLALSIYVANGKVEDSKNKSIMKDFRPRNDVQMSFLKKKDLL